MEHQTRNKDEKSLALRGLSFFVWHILIKVGGDVGEKVKKEAKTKKQEKKLTEKEKLFCLVYINNFNAASAVIKAGYNPKDRMNASRIGYELLEKTHIRKEITALKAEKMKSLNLNKDDIVERFMRIAFADMTDFIEFGREEVPVMTMYGTLEQINLITGRKETVKKEVNCIKFKDGSMVDGALICQIKQGKEGASLKLEDRQRALEWLADYFEMNPMNKHKRDYDKQRLELDKAKWEAEQQAKRPPEQTEDDGFSDAFLDKVTEEVWADDETASQSSSVSIQDVFNETETDPNLVEE